MLQYSGNTKETSNLNVVYPDIGYGTHFLEGHMYDNNFSINRTRGRLQWVQNNSATPPCLAQADKTNWHPACRGIPFQKIWIYCPGTYEAQQLWSPRFKHEGVANERPQSTEKVRPVASAGMNFSSRRVKKSCWEGGLTETPYMPVGMQRVLETTMRSRDIRWEQETCGS